MRRRQTILALLIYLEGEGAALKKLRDVVSSPLSLHRQTSGNAGDTDTQVRGTERGIAVEPILPTPALCAVSCLPLRLRPLNKSRSCSD